MTCLSACAASACGLRAACVRTGVRADQRDRIGERLAAVGRPRAGAGHAEAGAGQSAAGFAVSNPPRIALDFPNTANAMGRNVHEVSEGDLRRINVVQAGDRTRMVLELSRAVRYDTQVDGRTVLITLAGARRARPRPAAAPAVTQHFAEARPGDRRHALRDIDFRRGAGGEGRIIVDLSDSQVGIDVRTQGRNIVVEFANTARAAQPRAAHGRDRLRHAGAVRRIVRAGQQRAHGDHSRAATGSTRPTRPTTASSSK